MRLAAILRGPDGCPWDRAQTFRTLVPYLLEEAQELHHAVEAQSAPEVREELGDAAFVLTLLVHVAEEEGIASFSSVAAGALDKLVRRHPHVFDPDEPRAVDADDVARRWRERKRLERAERNDGSSSASAPTGSAEPLPGELERPRSTWTALQSAHRLQTQAAEVGFDWPSAAPVVEKISEELREVEELLLPASGGQPSARQRGALREEVGDLLFAVVNLARKLDVDPESALRSGTEKFRRRFNRMVALAAEKGEPFEALGLDALDRYWEAVKREELGRDRPGIEK